MKTRWEILGVLVGVAAIGYTYWQSRSPTVTGDAIELPAIVAEVNGSPCRSSEDEADASLELGDEITRANDVIPFLQCGSQADPNRANGTYQFQAKALPPEAKPVSFEAKVGIDGQSVHQQGTRASWLLVYDGRQVCSTPSVAFGEVYHWLCDLDGKIASGFDLDLFSIKQVVHPATTAEGDSLWAGLLDPTLNYQHH